MKHDVLSLQGRTLRKTWRTPLEKAAGEDPEAQYKWLHDIADGAAADVREAFMRAIERIKNTVKQADLEAAIASKSVERVLQVLGVDADIAAAIRQEMMPPLEDAMIEAGRATPEQALPKGGRLNIKFDLASPHTTRYLRNYEMNLIRQISNDTRAGIKQVVTSAFQFGAHPREQAREIRQMIGLTDIQAQWVQNYRDQLEGGDRAAMDRGLRDRRSDRRLNRALGAEGEGLDDDEIDRLVNFYQNKMLNARAETIARTETINAAQAGQQIAWEQASENGLLSRTHVRQGWLVTPDDRLCIVCALIPEMNPAGVPLGGYFQTPAGPVLRPTVHPNCRCSLYLLAF